MTVNPSDPEFFIWSGKAQFELIRSMLAGAGVDAASLGPVLDFGCGCGRIGRWWAELEGPELHGCDVNAELASWSGSNLAMDTRHTGLEPPLPYQDDRFELVYALSIFTHLPAGLERRWLTELTRVLRPGGLLWLTVAGEAHLDRLSPRDRAAFARRERVTQFADVPGTNLCAAFHPAGYVTGAMLAGFELLGTVPGSADGAAPTYSQDAYLARAPGAAQAS
jgi:SAM-dependent methyltransferase